jgi:broad-specificity NMP kinase
MPYIAQKRRKFFDQLLNHSQLCNILSPGDLNYVITKIVHQYVYGVNGLSYSSINEVIGVLECTKQELYRRLAGPYEDRKIKENGDV